ncbi:type II secretion system protein [Thiotrichales bacterium HSG1]|nr:type II secretion system protein [Thiotrichales bacterium HSG1]
MKMSQGFTLIEMAIVLVIIGFLMGGLLMPLSTQIDYQKIKETKKTLETIKDALIGYAILNNHLPCPSLDKDGKVSGYTDSVKNICTKYNSSDGYLPWSDLGVTQYDAWGNPFRYRVDGGFSDFPILPVTSSFPKPPVSNPSHELKVEDRDGNLLTSFENIATETNSNVMAIIYSCGKNGIPDGTNATGGYSGSNCSTSSSSTQNRIYTQDVYVENEFDDILTWLPKTILIRQLVLAGKWPPD